MGLWELPKDWQWTTIGNIIHSIKTGDTPSSTNERYYNGEIAWFSPSDIGINKILVHASRNITSTAVKENKAPLFEPGTLLITCIGNIGRAGILKSSASSNQQITGLIFQSNVLVDFVYWWTRTIQNHFQNLASKAVIPFLNQTNLKLVEIPIPYLHDSTRSLAEQRRIVARIEAIFTELQKCQQILGELQTETEQLMEAVLVDIFSEITRNFPGKQTINEITTVTSGGTPRRSRTEYYGGTIPWIKTGELKDNFIFDAEEYITELANAKQLPIDTLLIAMYGQGQTRGRTGLLKIKAAINQACCAIYPNPDKFDSLYLQFWFRHMYSRLRQQSDARGGTQSNLSQSIIKGLKPPLPPIYMQKHTVNLLSTAETEIVGMENTQQDEHKWFKEMEKAILNQAFRGEL